MRLAASSSAAFIFLISFFVSATRTEEEEHRHEDDFLSGFGRKFPLENLYYDDDNVLSRSNASINRPGLSQDMTLSPRLVKSDVQSDLTRQPFILGYQEGPYKAGSIKLPRPHREHLHHKAMSSHYQAILSDNFDKETKQRRGKDEVFNKLEKLLDRLGSVVNRLPKHEDNGVDKYYFSTKRKTRPSPHSHSREKTGAKLDDTLLGSSLTKITKLRGVTANNDPPSASSTIFGSDLHNFKKYLKKVLREEASKEDATNKIDLDLNKLAHFLREKSTSDEKDERNLDKLQEKPPQSNLSENVTKTKVSVQETSITSGNSTVDKPSTTVLASNVTDDDIKKAKKVYKKDAKPGDDNRERNLFQKYLMGGVTRHIKEERDKNRISVDAIIERMTAELARKRKKLALASVSKLYEDDLTKAQHHRRPKRQVNCESKIAGVAQRFLKDLTDAVNLDRILPNGGIVSNYVRNKKKGGGGIISNLLQKTEEGGALISNLIQNGERGIVSNLVSMNNGGDSVMQSSTNMPVDIKSRIYNEPNADDKGIKDYSSDNESYDEESSNDKGWHDKRPDDKDFNNQVPNDKDQMKTEEMSPQMLCNFKIQTVAKRFLKELLSAYWSDDAQDFSPTKFSSTTKGLNVLKIPTMQRRELGLDSKPSERLFADAPDSRPTKIVSTRLLGDGKAENYEDEDGSSWSSVTKDEDSDKLADIIVQRLLLDSSEEDAPQEVANHALFSIKEDENKAQQRSDESRVRKLKDVLKDFQRRVVSKMKEIPEKLRSKVKDIPRGATNASDELSSTVAKVTSKVTSIGKNVSKQVSDLGKKLTSAAKDIPKKASDLGEKITSTIKVVKEPLSKKVENMTKSLKTAVQKMKEGHNKEPLQVDVRFWTGSEDSSDSSEVPYQAALFTNDDFKCGASLLNHHFLLTAASCVDGVDPKNMWFRVGSNYLYNHGGKIYFVERHITNKEYVKASRHNIALIQSQCAVNYDSVRIRPARLPTIFAHTKEPDTSAEMSGWSKMSCEFPYIIQSETLKKASVALVSVDSFSLSVLPTKSLNNLSQMCLMIEPHEAKECIGDEGGPLIKNGVLVGVVSFAYPCVVGRPIVFTSVYTHLSWIYNTMAETLLMR